MKETDLKTSSIYKELYLSELDRKRFYDRLIQFPATLLVLFIGASLYSFNAYYKGTSIAIDSILDWVFVILLMAFIVSVLITIYYLSIVFHGFSRKYELLPYANELKSHECALYKYYYKYSEKNTYLEKRIDAQERVAIAFNGALEKYYVRLTTWNQKINDRRANAYYFSRAFLFIDLILLLIIGIISILIK